ncbi:MAG: restriction endonuclease subunit S [Flavobacteriales bacterium]|nr:restriction endonuclease subunit S [Flavobacteriales bacterium]
MQLLQHFKELTLHPKNAAELKGLILQLAVQGKLTAQWRLDNLNVEPASKLLKRIEAEKVKLVKEKKIPKDKKFDAIEDDEKPFELPSTWIWTRLGNAAVYIQRGKSPTYTDLKRYPVIAQKCVQWSGLEMYKAQFLDPDAFKKYGPERIVKTGDLLWNSTGRGSLGRIGFFDENSHEYELAVADSHVTVIRFLQDLLNSNYAFNYLCNPTIQDVIESKSSGSTNQIELATSTIKETVFPLPPLEEQKAIVTTVEQLFAEVEQLETLTVQRIQLKEDFVTSTLQLLCTSEDTADEWSFLKGRHFRTFFTEESNVKKLRESILQLAVQGKLTANWREENPNAEDASVLLKRIQAEKAKLIKEKKIKKENPLPPISEDEIPYDLPEGWVWCRLGDLLLYSDSGKSPDCEKRPVIGDEWGVLTTTAIQKNRFDQNANKVLPLAFEVNLQQVVEVGDILITRAGPINRTGIACKVDELEFNLILSDKTIRLKYINDLFYADYVVLALNNSELRDLLLDKMIGMASSQVNISQKNIKGICFPLPPLEEQKSVVEKVNSLMSLCDQLEQAIQTSKTTQENWMKSSLREVFEGGNEVGV